MRSVCFRAAGVGVAALLLIAAYKHPAPSSVMADAANAFLNSLWPDQKAKVSYAFDDDERLAWHFVPTGANYKPGDRELRKGMPLGAMQPFQRELATALLAAGLSQQGVIKAQSIMSLEQVLLILEGTKPANRRDPDNYFITIFGTPSAKGTWGYRIEGHHLAQNYTIVDGEVSDSPSFFGSNPAEVRIGPRKGLRVLALEDDYGYDMMESLDKAQQDVAVVDKTALKDIVTGASRKAALNGAPNGLSAAKMTAAQYDKLMTIIELYASNVPQAMAERRLQLARKQPKEATYFAWTGAVERGGLHYYRIQTPGFLIEMDCTQDQGNHVHSVWRDYGNDFGLDLLKAHYTASHQ
jgi:hypothetical protein